MSIAASSVIWDDNGTLKDLSLELSDILSPSKTIDIQSADHIYIGTNLPFNHRYFDIKQQNAQAATLTVEIWDGSNWNPVAAVIDDTKNENGIPFAKSGVISWTPDRNKAWSRVASTEDMAALSSLKIYNRYWARLSWSAAFDSDFALNYVGHRFSRDDDFKVQYPALLRGDLIRAFDESKEDWNIQHVMAAEVIVDELLRDRQILGPDQILDWQVFNRASVHKAAGIIMTAFGKEWDVERAAAEKAYNRAMDRRAFNIDQNNNARLEPAEQTTSGLLVRR